MFRAVLGALVSFEIDDAEASGPTTLKGLDIGTLVCASHGLKTNQLGSSMRISFVHESVFSLVLAEIISFELSPGKSYIFSHLNKTSPFKLNIYDLKLTIFHMSIVNIQ